MLTQPIKEGKTPIKIDPLIPTPIVTQDKEVVPIPKQRVYNVYKYVEPTGEALEIAIYVSEQSGGSLEIIKKIMWAESQYNAKAKGENKNGSYDTGYFQVNSQHIAAAVSMGMDIFTPKGNADFAIYLIRKNGFRDWGFSKSVWDNI